MKKSILLFILSVAVLSLSAQEKKNPEKLDLTKISSEYFLSIVRSAPSQKTWSKLAGTVTHRRSGSGAVESKIRLGVRFTPAGINGQLVLDGDEIYNLGQTFSHPPRSTVMLAGKAQDPKQARLGIFGISPDDLLLGFLYRDMMKEEAPQKVSIYHCRVFVMRSTADGEFTRVFISTDYAFPLKVQWFKSNPADDPKAEPYRAMEIVSIKEKDQFVLISKLRLDGPGWRTRVEFDDLDAGSAEKSVPKDLFINL